MTVNDVRNAVQAHIDQRADDERLAAEKLRNENLDRAYTAIVTIAGRVQDDMHDRFGIADNLYSLTVADVCDGDGNWWGGSGQQLVDECSIGRYPVAIDISCDIGSSYADINYTVSGVVQTVAGGAKVQQPIVNGWKIEYVGMGGQDTPDDKTLLEILSEEA